MRRKRGKPSARIYTETSRHGAVYYRLRVRLADGSSSSETFATRSDAEQAQAAAQAELERGLDVHVTGAMLAYTKYLIDVRGNKRSSAATLVRRLWALVGDGVEWVDELTHRQAEKLYVAYCETHASTTNVKTLKDAQRWGRWMAKQGWTESDPFAGVEPRGRIERRKPQLRRDDRRKLYAACIAEGGPEAGAVLMALVMGMRAGEIGAITEADMDEGGALVVVRRGKTRHSERELWVPESIRPTVLAKAKAGRRSRYWVHYHCTRMCEVAGVPKTSPHGLRGTQSTTAIESGVAIESVARALGHGSTGVTEQHYVEPSAIDNQQTRARLRVLSGGAK